MTNALAIIRSLVIYSLCLPLAIFLGYVLAMPLDEFNLIAIVVVISIPLIPILLRWHHVLLIASWNASMVLFFLPGRPPIYIVLAAISLLISILHQILHRDGKFISVPSVSRPLIFLLLVTIVTAQLTGGIGLRSMGGESVGGKRYIYLFAGIAGFFALSYQRVPKDKAMWYVAIFLLGSLTAIIGSLAPFMDQSLYFLFMIFPVENIQALWSSSDASISDLSMRLGGVSFACVAAVNFLLARHGIRGIFDLSVRWRFLPVKFRDGFGINQPWRLLLFFFLIWMSLTGGYRSVAISIALTFFFQFFLERMHRTALLPIFALAFFMSAAIALPLVHKLPMTVQRSLAFLPLNIDPVARYSAEASSEWRKNIWREVIPTIPQYLLVGKGFAIKPEDLEMQRSFGMQSATEAGEGAKLAGDYHNGPLSLIIPLGAFGAIAFIWFLVAATRLLISNYRYGDAELKIVNTLLLAMFLSRTVMFIFVFGSFYNELAAFTGIAALSICINNGLRRPAPATEEKPALPQFQLARAAR